MKKISMFFVVFISLFIVCQEGFADFSAGEIERIYPVSDTVYFRLKDDICITGSQYYFFRMNDVDSTGKYASKNWYAMLLASAMAGKPIRVKVSTCPAEGNAEIVYIFQDY